MMDFINALLGSGDAAMPDLGQLFMDMGPWLRLVVLAGPVCLLVMGLIYLLAAPKEANHSLGYRCYFGMGSVEAWQFTQRLAGIVWTALGGVLTVVMIVRCWGFGSVSGYDMAVSAVWSLIWELALLLISRLGINITVMALYDRDGFRRERN